MDWVSEPEAYGSDSDLLDVEGWTVLVTGGTTGIGLMIAQAFTNNGAHVYIVNLDVLVNTTSVSLDTSNTYESADSIFQLLSHSSLSFQANRADHTASGIDVSAISGTIRTMQHHFMYNVLKAGTIQLNTLLAQELRKSRVHIRVSSIAPGIFLGRITSRGKDEVNKSEIPVRDDYREKKAIPAGRPGAETDMAQTDLFLHCNQYIYDQATCSNILMMCGRATTVVVVDMNCRAKH
ncbi:hypothetical protein BC835DRAFT_1450687 [Cytidiella melzeri]|nr:hypothetical protein BC835DRAFT_1450687 [Cytidiella melzeri]